MGLYIGVDGVARNVKSIYVGVGGVARKVAKGYIGVNGIARQFYSSGLPLSDLPEGSLVWAVIDAGHAGTIDAPIPAARGMEYTYGLYYLDPEDGKTYLCKRGEETGSIVLYYLPHELIGRYFEEVI